MQTFPRDTLAHEIHRLKELILLNWEEKPRPTLPSAKRQTSIPFREDFSLFLDRLALSLDNRTDQQAASEWEARERHARQLAEMPDYDPVDIAREYEILHEVIVEALGDRLHLLRNESAILRQSIHEAIQTAISVTTDRSLTSRRQLETTLASIGDAVIAISADDQPRITFINRIAEKLTGWSCLEAKGRLLSEVFDVINAKTRQPALGPIASVLREGRMTGLANHKILRSRSGQEYPIEDNAAPIVNEQGLVSGVILVFRDVTDKAALIERSELFNAVLEKSKDFIGMADGSGKPFYVNPAGRRVVGLDSLEEVKQTAIIDYFPAEEKARVTNEIMPHVFSEGAWDGRVLFQNFKTGERIPFSWNMVAVRSPETGEIEALACISKDLRDQELKESIAAQAAEVVNRARLDLLDTIESISDAFLSVDDAWTITQVNKMMVRFTQKSREELIGANFLDLFFSQPDTCDTEYWARYNEAMSKKTVVSFDDFYAPLTIWRRVRVYPKADGGLAIFFTDISVEKRALQALADSEAYFRAIAEATPQMLFITDASGNVTYHNQILNDYLGANFGDLKEWEWTQIFHPEDRRRVIDRWSYSLATGEPFECTYRIRRFDGICQWFLGRATALRDAAGTIVKWMGTATNIDDQKRLEVALKRAKSDADEANRVKSHFLANMSHEIRTPLTAIMGFAELLRDGSLNADRHRDAVETILRNSTHLLQLVNDILDISKVESGKLEVDRQRLSLPDFVNDLSTVFKQKANDKGISITFDSNGPIPKYITTDATRFRQILLNILSNAIKFTDSGSVTMTFATNGLNESGGKYLLVTVRDTGCGLSKDQADRLFKPFVQADSTTTRKYGGTGLGLALSRQLAEALNGSLTLLHSELGVGSAFALSIPLEPSDLREGIVDFREPVGECLLEPRGQEQQQVPQLSGLRVLVVEDAIDNQRLIAYILHSEGCFVEIAANGLEGVNLALRGHFDVILMDIQMPILDGYDATRRLRAEGFTQPIIALSAHAMASDRNKALEAGCTDTLTKPIDLTRLLNTLSQVRKDKTKR